jgi:uncharacterized protein with beta-barrel porin domain
VGTPGSITSSALGTGSLTFNGGTLQAGGNYTVANAGLLNTAGGTIDANTHTLTVSGAITNGNRNTGTVNIIDSSGGGTIVFTGANGYSGATVIGDSLHSVILQAGAAGAFSASSATTVTTLGTVDLSGFAQTINAVTLAGGTIQNGALTGAITSSGGTVKGIGGAATLTTTSGTTSIIAANTYTGATTVSGGTLVLASTGSITSNVTNSATFTTSGTVTGTVTNTGTVNANGGTVTGAIANNAGSFNVGGAFAGNATFANAARASLAIGSAGSFNLGGLLSNAGTVTVANGGTLTATAGGITNSTGGTITVSVGGAVRDDLNNAGLVTNNGTYVANVASNSGSIINNGNWIGTINNNGGSFNNTGTINGAVTISGGALFGAGSVTGNLAIGSGAAFAPGSGTPGSSMTVNGSLAFSSGALYQVAINPQTASFVTVTGSATLGGASVQAFFGSGSYVSKQYIIVNAAGGISGTFNTLANTNLPSGFTSSLSYDATHAYLNLALNFTPPTAPANNWLTVNQRNVGNALVNSFNTVGMIPIVFGALTPSSLTQVSGELATSSEQTTFKAMNLFLGLLTDPFAGRGDGVNGATSPAGYADEATGTNAANRATDTFAMFTKAPPAIFAPRWSVWVAGYGGSQSTNGNAVLGANDTTSGIAGTAVGADYRISPDTLAGFALAGGGTSFGVNNLGSGRSDLFQAGAYARHAMGAAYISGAVAYGWQNITTNRTMTIVGIDQLRARFNTNAYSGRVEGGYRFVAPVVGGVGITPYAAGQFTTFDLPAYAETAVSGAPTFALAYGAKSITDTRSELGLRTDKSFAMQNGVLTLRSRVAWAHDFDPDRSIAATFQTLPGSSFVVNGAAQARDFALTTAAAEMKWINGWSAAATFEGEFSNFTHSYAGKSVLRYAW